ncbi:SDR family oxidoreductase [Bhargavaea cecembensis]|uniref:SDR family oxidoreductase n=1 Tax=Bhargavaea cecembensis TaxID=394098 RepID=UPI00059059D4|nr:SDR family oxidoreductase [Bhargavaea cecembensis]
MNVLVIGANGQIGRQVVGLLKESKNHTPRAMVRSEEQAGRFERDGVETIVADLEGSVEQLTRAMVGIDAVVFAAGSGGHTGPDKTLLIDLDGAVKSMEAAEKGGIGRFILISALQANHRENWNETIRPYYVAKHYADRALTESSLDYTIIRPGGLMNTPGTGRVTAAENLEGGSISREDVARTIVAALDEDKTIRRAFDLVAGDTSIAEALEKI